MPEVTQLVSGGIDLDIGGLMPVPALNHWSALPVGRRESRWPGARQSERSLASGLRVAGRVAFSSVLR